MIGGVVMVIDLPVWFVVTTNIFGLILLYLSFKMWQGKQISLLGNIGELKKESHLNTVCKLTSIYSFVLGAMMLTMPLVNLLFTFHAVILLVVVGIIGSIIFWFALQKVYFTVPVR